MGAQDGRTLFRGLRLSYAKDHRRSGRPHARDSRCEDHGRREGRMVSTRGISHSSISRRVHHRRTADRHRAHSCGAGGDVRAIGLRFTQRATPHPALRATFPTSWRRGRDGRCEDQGRREGCMVSTRGISHSSISRRVHHRRTADRHRAHSCGAGGDVRAIGLRFMQRATPHPALRATFPTSWRRERLAGRPTAMMAASPAAVRRDQ